MARKPRIKYPEHAVEHRVMEAALEVSDSLFAKLMATLDLTHELQELLRQQREDDRNTARPVRAAGGTHKFISKGDQYKTITALVSADARYRDVHSQVLQDVADRVERKSCVKSKFSTRQGATWIRYVRYQIMGWTRGWRAWPHWPTVLSLSQPSR